MKKIIVLICLVFILVSCWEVVLEWKFDNLPNSAKKEISTDFYTQVIWFKSNEAKKLMTTEVSSKDMPKEMEKIDNDTRTKFNTFKLKYKDIDFSWSSFLWMCWSFSTEWTCFE